jgi:hypothetical protein
MSTVRGGGEIVTDGLVFYVDAANSKSYISGDTTWNDLSRSGADGTLTSGVTFSSENKGSITFDGSSDYVVFDIGPTNTETEFTYCFFAKRTASHLANIINRGNSGRGIWLGMGTTNFTLTIGKVADYPVPYSTTEGEVYYVCFAVNDTEFKLYVNGLSAATETISSTRTNSNSNSWYLGAILDTNGNINSYKNQNVYSVKKYNRQLSSSEIVQNYNTLKGRYDL